MSTEQEKSAVGKFPLRMMSSVRHNAEEYSLKEGVSLNQFINVAVAEKVAHLQHEEWLSKRKKPSAARIAKGLALLSRAGTEPTQAGDELPEGYAPEAAPPAATKNRKRSA